MRPLPCSPRRLRIDAINGVLRHHSLESGVGVIPPTYLALPWRRKITVHNLHGPQYIVENNHRMRGTARELHLNHVAGFNLFDRHAKLLTQLSTLNLYLIATHVFCQKN